MSKVKINKVVPRDLLPATISYQPIIIQGKQYVPYKNDSENFVGYPIYLFLGIILPDSADYEYLKVQAKAQIADFNKVVNKQNQKFTEIKKSQTRRDMLFRFLPKIKGNYVITVDTFYRSKYFVQGSQPPPEKRDSSRLTIKCEDPIEIEEKILTEDVKGFINFPMFVQYTINSRIGQCKLNFTPYFSSEKLNVEALHVWDKQCQENQNITIGKSQSYFLMYKLWPKSVQEICGSKQGLSIGTLKLEYGQKQIFEKHTSFTKKEKYLFFRGQTLNKNVPKKDIVEIQVKFSKLQNRDFGLNDLKLVITQNAMPDVKILKASTDKINLDKNKEVIVKFSIICMKSGALKLEGIALHGEKKQKGGQTFLVLFINDLLLFVGTEPEHKSQMILENTNEINIEEDLL